MIPKSDNSSYEKFIFFTIFLLIESLIQTKEKRERGRESFGKKKKTRWSSLATEKREEELTICFSLVFSSIFYV